jgi:hypothetical protein
MKNRGNWKTRENRKTNLNKLRKIIKEAGEIAYPDILEKMKPTSEVTIADYLKELYNNEEIESFKKKNEDMRRTFYKPKEKVDAQIGRYEAIQFIESLQNPLYAKVPIDGITISAFAEFSEAKNEKSERDFRGEVVADTCTFASSLTKMKLGKGEKIALVVTIEGKEVI